ncbi:hypothetical protein [Bacillus sp. UNCCL81]|uniref:hypothetical protein n=1 Tax=Bacillus sp. UNCCL81 TaxID=1502755 RepID=UPI0008EFA256|nr:hypothetical protein [Bacillus sp. UNCCL81]SFC51960.1 hypothetical protein SAMN02799633_01072 [Bacillus sp. UNCCL81]
MFFNNKQDSNFEKHDIFDKESNKSFFAITEQKSNGGNTFLSLELFAEVKELFGKFERAVICDKNSYISDLTTIQRTMQKINEQHNDYLVLIDDSGNQLHLTGCKSGYTGTGARGTFELLADLGFDIDMRFIITAHVFDIRLSEYYKEKYSRIAERDKERFLKKS